MKGRDGGGDTSPVGNDPSASASPRIARQIAAAFGPIVLAVVFFGVLTPIGVILRIAGRDRLQLRPRRDTASYWLPVAARGRNR